MERHIPRQGEVWKHYKGGLYETVLIAKHEDDGQSMVVYQPIGEANKAYTRSLNEFMAVLDDGKYRFQKEEEQSINKEPSKNEQALRSTYGHIETVSRLLLSAAFELLKRVVTHDRSKLAEPEWEMFARITETLNGLTYGSAEYEAQRKEMLGQALGHHYSHNRHNPEFFESRQLSPKDDNYREYVDLIKWIEDSPLKLDVRDIENFRLMILFFEGKEKEATSSINNMTLFDVLEMVVDWRAACNFA